MTVVSAVDVEREARMGLAAVMLGESKLLAEVAADGPVAVWERLRSAGDGLVWARRALYEAGVIGKLRTVVVEYPQDWLVDALERETEEEKTWRSIPELSGRGAAIGDIGSHMENWVHYVTGLKVTAVLANLEAIGSGTMLDNNIQVITKFENGASGFFWAARWPWAMTVMMEGSW